MTPQDLMVIETTDHWGAPWGDGGDDRGAGGLRDLIYSCIKSGQLLGDVGLRDFII